MIIKELRVKNGWSQEQLADLTGLSTRTIQRIEKEDAGSLESLKLLADAFQMDVQALHERLHTKETSNVCATTSFGKSLGVFVGVNAMLLVINLTTSPHHLWFIYPLIGWGIALLYKYYKRRLKASVAPEITS